MTAFHSTRCLIPTIPMVLPSMTPALTFSGASQRDHFSLFLDFRFFAILIQVNYHIFADFVELIIKI